MPKSLTIAVTPAKTAKATKKVAKPLSPEQIERNRLATNAARSAVKIAGEQEFSTGKTGHMVRGTTKVNGREAWVSISVVYKPTEA